MKKFIVGMLVGYLLTSIFSIPALPEYFWYFSSGVVAISLILWSAWHRFNDDLHEGEF